MVILLRKIHLVFYFVAVFFYFILGYPFLLFYSRNVEKHYDKIVFLRKWISVLSMYTAGFRVHVHYDKPFKWDDGPYVICPNHTSILDISILNFICPLPFSYIGKIELLRNPVTGIFFRTIDIPVNRDSKTSSFRAFRKGKEVLAKGKSLVIFPEGKIADKYPPRLHPFKTGPFRIATDNEISVVPIVIQNVWRLLWDSGQNHGSKPGTIRVRVLQPISTKKKEIAKYGHTLEEEVYNRMLKVWKKTFLDKR